MIPQLVGGFKAADAHQTISYIMQCDINAFLQKKNGIIKILDFSINFHEGQQGRGDTKSVKKLFHLKNIIFCYSIYKLKKTVIFCKINSNFFFSFILLKNLTFCKKTCFRIFAISETLLVKNIAKNYFIKNLIKSCININQQTTYSSYLIFGIFEEKPI